MPPGRAKKSFKLSPLEQKLVVYFKAMLSYASIKKEVIRSLELSLLEGYVHAQAFFFFFFYSWLLLPPHSSINFHLGATAVVFELVMQATAKLGKKQVNVALASYGCKHFHLTLRWKAKNRFKERTLPLLTIYIFSPSCHNQLLGTLRTPLASWSEAVSSLTSTTYPHITELAITKLFASHFKPYCQKSSFSFRLPTTPPPRRR